MEKKTIAAIIKLIPVISVIVSYALIFGNFNAAWTGRVTSVTVILAFLGFGFFFIGRRLGKEDRTLKILGILDILSSISIIVLYALSFASIGM
jgi:hypothetical protein